ncbi:MAG: RNA polymerase sigma-70 factor [Tannerella sp.]|jgi:RNA polymerase sigma-70 factor (ECF subfamily)|nr:RNA polymerase sigma-70 factor [Tannerella sp.]
MEKLSRKEMVDDVFLLKLIRENDRQAFKYLFDGFFIPLCRFADTFVNDRSVAEDIVMDVFTAVWEKRNGLEIDVSWKAYLFQSVRNRALNHIRDNGRFVSTSDWSFYDKAETDDSFELNELERLIREAVCSLPDHCGEIFRKSRFEHHTNREIATELNISVKYVEAQITKALKFIRKYLGDSYTYLW